MLAKLMRISHPLPSWKKISNQVDSEENKKSKKFNGLKKLIPKMGNFTSAHRHQHVIDNVEDHATRVLQNLTELREKNIGCDLVFPGTEIKPAHKIIVSFNPILTEIISSSSETVAVTIDEEAKQELDVDVADVSEVSKLNLESSEDASKQEKDETGSDLVSELKTSNIVDHIDTNDENAVSSENKQGNLSENELKDCNDEEKCDGNNECDAVESRELEESCDISPPLFSEMKVEVDIEETLESEVCDNQNKDVVVTPDETSIDIDSLVNSSNNATAQDEVEDKQDSSEENSDLQDETTGGKSQNVDFYPPLSLNDPVDVLINFFYTSHIDITQKNVTPLRILASQCSLNDVMTACDEFNRVLYEETEHMTTVEEKDEVASKFRYRYSDPSMPIKILQHLDNLRKQKNHTNLVLISSSEKFHLDVHSLVVASASRFFDPVVTNETTASELRLPEIDEDVFESVVSFLYSGKVEINPLYVSHLVQAANRMQLDDVIEGCCEYFEAATSVQNCIQHRTLAIQYKCTKLKDFVDDFIATHFIAVSNSPDFMSLSVESLIDITSNNELALEFPIAKGEITVFNSIRNWVIHDEESRKQHLAEVMKAVRFPLMSSESLVHHVSTDLLIMSCPEMSRRITDVITSAPLMSFSEPVSMRGKECILILGGSYPVEDETSEERGYQAVNYSSQVTAYNPFDLKLRRFNELTNLPETRALHCAIACDQFVFVVGGFDPHSCIVNTVYCFDLANGIWSTMPNMKIKRSCFSLHALGGYLYAVGGLTPKGYTATVEKLDRKKKVWTFATSLPTSKYRHAGCVLNDKILISGGNEKMDLVLSYNPSTDSWNKEMPMNIGRNSHAMISENDTAYVFGGEEIPFSAESYKNKTWTMLPIPSFHFPSLFFPGCVALGNCIFLCGGWETPDNPAYNIRYFDTVTSSWEILNCVMPVPRGSAGACAIRIPRNYWKTKFLVTKT